MTIPGQDSYPVPALLEDNIVAAALLTWDLDHRLATPTTTLLARTLTPTVVETCKFVCFWTLDQSIKHLFDY